MFQSKHNPYVELLSTKPHSIFPFVGEALTEEESTYLKKQLNQYKNHYCELGAGSGTHLVKHALIKSDALFMGFEIRYKRIYKTAEKADQHGLKNILLFRTEAQNILKYIPPLSLDGLYINFPDPWDKRRWFKHRMINPEFMNHLDILLKPGAFFSFKTDHADYYDTVLKLVEADKRFVLTKHTRDLHNSEWNETNIVTEFETLFKSQKKPAYFLEMVKN